MDKPRNGNFYDEEKKMVLNFVSVVVKLLLNPLNLIIGGFFLTEAIKHHESMNEKQPLWNVLSMIAIGLFSINWPWWSAGLHIAFAVIPFALNWLDLTHLPEEKTNYEK